MIVTSNINVLCVKAGYLLYFILEINLGFKLFAPKIFATAALCSSP